MNSFQFIDIIILLGVSQGIFLSLTLQQISNNNRNANRILSTLLILSSIMLIGRFVYFRFFNVWIFQWSLLVDSLVFLFGPIVYMYIRRLLFKASAPYSLSLLHFMPFLIMFGTVGFYIVYFTPNEHYNLFIESNGILIFNILSIFMIAFNFAYLIKSLLLLKSYSLNERDTVSFNQTPLAYLRFFLMAFGASLLAWLFSLINSSFLDNYVTFINYESIWVAIPILIYVIGYFSLKQQELFRIPLEPRAIHQRDRLTTSESSILAEKLDSLMVNEKIYLQSNLTLNDIAEVLHTSRNNISWLLSNVYKTTFYDFINSYRIREFVNKIKKREHLQHTILALAMDVGFNSKATFNRVFKANMKETPRSFIKNLSAA